MRIKNEDERNFYEIEASNQGWAFRTLQGQYASSLNERLLLSSDEDKVIELASQGQVMRGTSCRAGSKKSAAPKAYILWSLRQLKAASVASIDALFLYA